MSPKLIVAGDSEHKKAGPLHTSLAKEVLESTLGRPATMRYISVCLR